MTDGWTWPLSKAPKTSGTNCRFLVGVLPLEPLPGGRPVELRLYLKQWDAKAAAPYSWRMDLMKFAGESPGKTMDPFQPLQHVQISEKDWETFFSVGVSGRTCGMASRPSRLRRHQYRWLFQRHNQEVKHMDLLLREGRTVPLEPSGDRYVDRCPLCGTPAAFHVIPGKGLYHCFGCKAHGEIHAAMVEGRPRYEESNL